MFQPIGKPLIFTLISIASIFIGFSSHADELLSRAAAQLKVRDYGNASILAQKAPESPQRSFMLGVANLRQDKAAEAIPLLVEAEHKLPLLGDYAALYQAEALFKLKRYVEAAAKAASIPKIYPSTLLTRRSEKLLADIFFDSGDYKGALKICRSFIERYPSGSDSIDVLFKSGRCREEAGDKNSAAQVYRGIWLNNPAEPQASKAWERIQELEKSGVKIAAFTPEELFQRASALYARNQRTDALQTLQSIPLEGQTPEFAARVDLRIGMAHFRLRNYKQAEKSLTKAAASSVAGIRAEARFWLAKSIEQQERYEQAFDLYMELAREGGKQELSDDALMEAAGMRRGLGLYLDAARLYEQVSKSRPDSRLISRAAWESAWCRYLAGDYAGAAESLKILLKDGTEREKSLYWLGRSLENIADVNAATYFRTLLDEYPDGFYAAWYRDQRGLGDSRESLGQRNALAELPLLSGFEKPRLLASLGMPAEARSEMGAAIKKMGDKKKISPGLTRLYLEMGDYRSALGLFKENSALKWDKTTLPLWTAGYPKAYSGQVGQYSSANSVSEALIYAMIRTESSFSNEIRSPAGAIGLMQLMPNTAKDINGGKEPLNPLRLTDPEFNIKLGTRYFRELLNRYDGDAVYAIAAYNAGSGTLGRWRKKLNGLKKDEFIENIPYRETRDYIKKVYASAATYRQLYGLK